MNPEYSPAILDESAPVKYSISVISDPEDLNRWKEEWDQLVLRDQHSTIFQSWAWNYLHGVNQSHNRSLLKILQIFSAGGELIGIVPLQLLQQKIAGIFSIQRLEFIGTGDSDYLGIIVKPGEEAVVLRILLQWLFDTRTTWDVVNFQSLSEDSFLVKNVEMWNKKFPWHYSLMPEEVCPYIELSGIWSCPLDGLPNSLTKYIKRKQRRIYRDKEVHVRTIQCADDLQRHLEKFFVLHRKRMKEKSLPGFFQTENQNKMFIEISHELLKRGWLRFLIIEIDGEVAGGIYAFAFKDKCYFYQSGLDPRFKSYSLGYLLHYYLIEEVWKEGCKEYDFLRGDEMFKKQWTETAHHLFCLRIFSDPFKEFIYRTHDRLNRWLMETMLFNKIYMKAKKMD